MQYFSIGLVFVTIAALFPTGYVIGRKVRVFGSWLLGTEPPKEKFWPMLIILLVFGLVVGGLAQKQWDTAQPCLAKGHPPAFCTLFAG